MSKYINECWVPAMSVREVFGFDATFLKLSGAERPILVSATRFVYGSDANGVDITDNVINDLDAPEDVTVGQKWNFSGIFLGSSANDSPIDGQFRVQILAQDRNDDDTTKIAEELNAIFTFLP